jgi:hypothetical protein
MKALEDFLAANFRFRVVFFMVLGVSVEKTS